MPVRLKTGTVVAFSIVAGAILLAVVALVIRPPPPSQRGPAATRPAVPAEPSSAAGATNPSKARAG